MLFSDLTALSEWLVACGCISGYHCCSAVLSRLQRELAASWPVAVSRSCHGVAAYTAPHICLAFVCKVGISVLLISQWHSIYFHAGSAAQADQGCTCAAPGAGQPSSKENAGASASYPPAAPQVTETRQQQQQQALLVLPRSPSTRSLHGHHEHEDSRLEKCIRSGNHAAVGGGDTVISPSQYLVKECR